MPKKKISKKLAEFSSGKSQAKAYKPGTEVSINGLREAITEALFESDFDTFKGCIAILLDKYDYRVITKATGLSKSTLYRMCEPTANPTLENVCKVLSFINDLDESRAA
jgi:hypothetical protein